VQFLSENQEMSKYECLVVECELSR